MSRIFANGVAHGDNNKTEILANALINKKELVRTIDSMQHKLDSLNNGNVFVTPDEEIVKIDSGSDGKMVSFTICNRGNMPVRLVEIEIKIVLLNDLSQSIPYLFFRHSFAPNDCWDFHETMPDIKIGTFLFIYKISYQNKKENIIDYYTVKYSEKIHKWGLNPSRFGRLFK